jgi:hypothetical protein
VNPPKVVYMCHKNRGFRETGRYIILLLGATLRLERGGAAATPIFRFSRRGVGGIITRPSSSVGYGDACRGNMLYAGPERLRCVMVPRSVGASRWRSARTRSFYPFRWSSGRRRRRLRSALFTPGLHSQRVRFKGGRHLRANNAFHGHRSRSRTIFDGCSHVWAA